MEKIYNWFYVVVLTDPEESGESMQVTGVRIFYDQQEAERIVIKEGGQVFEGRIEDIVVAEIEIE
jgi:hypothetical protein